MSVGGGPEWDGRGLPPVAAERVRRAAAGGPWTSLLSAPEAAALKATEYEPVGEVMGSIVQNIGWRGSANWGACGMTWGGFMGPATPVPAFTPYVEALTRGYDTALYRLLLEAQALGAHGVVGVTLTADHLDTGSREFIALGTAVRSRAAAPDTLFVTSMPGTDVTKLLGAGWLPTSIVYGIAVSIRHDDWSTRQQASWGAGNVEVTGHTQLVTAVRADARHRFGERVRAAGAQGAIVSSMGVRMSEIEPSDNHRDHVAEAFVFGDALVGVPHTAHPPRSSLTMMPL